MDSIILILIALAAVKSVIFGFVLYRVFRQDIKHWWNVERHGAPAASSTPVCVYCRSAWTEPTNEGQSRWDGDDLVLVTTYQCQHCKMPFWHVDRVRTGVAGDREGTPRR